MSQTIELPPAGFDSLSVEEQIDYLQSLWERIAAQPEQVPVPNWHREVLDERLAALSRSPDEGKNWDDFDRELTKELQNNSKQE
jgi:putative addiction module component (TIGR02574 family)